MYVQTHAFTRCLAALNILVLEDKAFMIVCGYRKRSSCSYPAFLKGRSTEKKKKVYTNIKFNYFHYQKNIIWRKWPRKSNWGRETLNLFFSHVYAYGTYIQSRISIACYHSTYSMSFFQAPLSAVKNDGIISEWCFILLKTT